MLLWPPLSKSDERFVESTSSGRVKLTTPLFNHFTLNPGKALLTNPFQRGYLRWIGRIHQSLAIGGANGSTMVVMFVDCCVGGGRYFLYYSYHRNSMGREFFVLSGTLIAVKLLMPSADTASEVIA
jgi:hypothetical protein